MIGSWIAEALTVPSWVFVRYRNSFFSKHFSLNNPALFSIPYECLVNKIVPFFLVVLHSVSSITYSLPTSHRSIIPFQQLRLNPEKKREKTYRIKTNNQELLIRKQNESDATSRWIDFQKTSLRKEKDEYELTLEIFNLSTIRFFFTFLLINFVKEEQMVDEDFFYFLPNAVSNFIMLFSFGIGKNYIIILSTALNFYLLFSF